MKIKEVRIKNFRGFGENPNDDEGYYKFRDLDEYKLIIFNGYNGFGKTSFFDAIEWCLTNTISRIQSNETLFYKKNLKASHYLKFVNERDSSDRNRIVEVILIFDDGTFIKRATTCWSIHDASYSRSTKFLNENGKNIDDHLVWNKLVNNNLIDPKEFMSVNFLGQENMNAFLRSKSPIERTKSLMQLIGQAKLSEIVELSRKENFMKLNTHIGKISENINDIINAENELTALFNVNNWGEINQFFDKIKNSINSILEFEKSLEFKELWGLSSIFLNKDINTSNITHVLDLCRQKYLKLNNDNLEYKNEYNLMIELWFLNIIIMKYKKVLALSYVQSKDVNTLSGIMEKHLKIQSNYSNDLLYLKRLSTILETYKGLWNNIKININLKKHVIKDEFWGERSNLEQRVDNLFSIINDYKEYIQNASLLTNKLDSHYWKQIQIRYIKFSKIIKKLEANISSLETSIRDLSDLNNNYKNVLLNVEDYIIEQDRINACPICLNNDFSRVPNEILVNLDENPTVKDILLNIIRFTIMNGNNSIEKLNRKIEYKKFKYNNLISSLDKIILLPTLNDINTIIQEFDAIYLTIERAISTQENCIEKRITYYKNKYDRVSEEISQYKKLIIEYLGHDNVSELSINMINTKKLFC